MDKLKLNIGCGSVRIDGEIGVDAYPTSEVDVIADIFSLPYENESCEFVRLDHVLEHIQYRSVVRALLECKRVLCTNGLIRIGVPDMGETCKAFYEAKTLKEMSDLSRNIYGGQQHEGEFHKSGFNKIMLYDILKSVGFIDIDVSHDPNRDEGICMQAFARKPGLDYLVTDEVY